MKATHCLVIVTALMTVFQTTTSVKVVVIRENSSSKSVEESEEKSSVEDSEEIDFLLDLIRKENSNRKSQPSAKTVKVVRRKPSNKEITSESTIRKEKLKKPSDHKEYHVHYHNHQHRSPEAPSLKLEEDKLHPIIWDSFSTQLGGLHDYKPFAKTRKEPIMMPVSSKEKLNYYKNYDSFLTGKIIPSSSSDEYVIGETSDELFKQFHTSLESELLAKKLEFDRNRKILKKYQALLNSAASLSSQPKIKLSSKELSSSESTPTSAPAKSPPQRFKSARIKSQPDFRNQERFAGFTDFSSIESPQAKDKTRGNQQNSKAEDSSDDKDFAYIIKTKQSPTLRPTQRGNIRQSNQQVKHRKGIVPPKIQHPKNVRDFKNPRLNIPRILDAPGGVPLHVEKLNQWKANRELSKSPLFNEFPRHLNAVESGPRLLHVHPLQRPNMFNSKLYNGWFFERIQR